MSIEKLNFKQSFIEKLLNKNYKWWYLFVFYIKSNTTYRWSSLIWLLSRFFSVLATLLVWYISITGGFNLFNFSYTFTYYILGNLFFLKNNIHYHIGSTIMSGDINTKAIRPSSLWLQWFLENIGWNFFSIVTELILYILTGFLGLRYVIAPASFVNLSLALLCALLGYSCNVFCGFIVGFLAFYLTDYWGAADLLETLKVYLSGKLIPLDLFSYLLPIAFFPFAFSFYHPMQIYLNKYNFQQTVLVLTGALLWSFSLYLLAKTLFTKGFLKYQNTGS